MITFRDLVLTDCRLIREWVKTNPFTKKWYFNDKIPRISTLERKFEKRLKLKDFNLKIVLKNNIPIGYIQSYPVDGNGAWTSKVKVCENMVSLDYFIGDINYIHKGLGAIMINEYIEQIIKKENFKAVLISPDPNNLAQKNLMEKCGFEFIKTVNVPYKNSKTLESVYIKYL